MFDGCALLGAFCLHGFSGYWRTSDASVTEGAFFIALNQGGILKMEQPKHLQNSFPSITKILPSRVRYDKAISGASASDPLRPDHVIITYRYNENEKII